VEEIFIAVGHEGIMSYMALVAKASEEVKVLLKGQNTNLEGKNPLDDNVAMEWLRQAFHNNTVYEWQMIGEGWRGSRK
jgi:hypothetical protein